jgi:hypothetical protein
MTCGVKRDVGGGVKRLETLDATVDVVAVENEAIGARRHSVAEAIADTVLENQMHLVLGTQSVSATTVAIAV